MSNADSKPSQKEAPGNLPKSVPPMPPNGKQSNAKNIGSCIIVVAVILFKIYARTDSFKHEFQSKSGEHLVQAGSRAVASQDRNNHDDSLFQKSNVAQAMFSKSSTLWSADGTVERKMMPERKKNEITYTEELILHIPGMPTGSTPGDHEKQLALYEIRSDGIYLTARIDPSGRRTAIDSKYAPLSIPTDGSIIKVGKGDWRFTSDTRSSGGTSLGSCITRKQVVASMVMEDIYCKDHGRVMNRVANMLLQVR